MKLKLYIILTISLLFAGCIKEWGEVATGDGPVTVGFFAGGEQTRTTINSDGISSSWSKDDKVALWAINSEGTATLSAQPFKIYYRDGQTALFTATLATAMAEGSYNYYATYPVPESVNSTLASFSLPASQDGQISNGAAIMIATPASGKQLGVVTGAPGADDANEIDDNHLSLKMKHAMHALKFFVMQDKWGFAEGETIERIVFTMPQAIAGNVTLDYTNPSSAHMVTNGVNTMALNLARNIGPSASAANPDFAAASIIPTEAFNDGDEMTLKIYAQTKVAKQTISLSGRDAMQAGHITPVAIDCREALDKYVLRFKWGGNNLGEDVNFISFHTADGNEVYRITDVATFEKTGVHEIDYSFIDDKTAYTSLAGQTITAKYDSDHAVVSQTFVMPTINIPGQYQVTLTVPYLFFEDFSSISTFSDGKDNVKTGWKSDTYNDTKNIGSLDSYLNNWWASRIGGSSGTSVRICCRYEAGLGAAAYYHGRLDSPFMPLKDGVNVKLNVSFNYGGNREEYKLTGTVNKNPMLYFGYSQYASGNESSNLKPGNSKTPSLSYIASSINGLAVPINGSYTSMPNSGTSTLPNCNNQTRLTWVVSTDRSGGNGNGNYWLYIDNIKVQIVQ